MGDVSAGLCELPISCTTPSLILLSKASPESALAGSVSPAVSLLSLVVLAEVTEEGHRARDIEGRKIDLSDVSLALLQGLS